MARRILDETRSTVMTDCTELAARSVTSARASASRSTNPRLRARGCGASILAGSGASDLLAPGQGEMSLRKHAWGPLQCLNLHITRYSTSVTERRAQTHTSPLEGSSKSEMWRNYGELLIFFIKTITRFL